MPFLVYSEGIDRLKTPFFVTENGRQMNRLFQFKLRLSVRRPFLASPANGSKLRSR